MNGYLVVYEELPNSVTRSSTDKSIVMHEPIANLVLLISGGIIVQKVADRTKVIRISDPNLIVSKQNLRSWVVSHAPILIDTSIREGTIWVDPVTTIVFVYIRSPGSGFDLVEIGTYAEICRDVTFTSSTTAPVSPNLGDMWQKTDTGELFTYIQDELGSYVWAELSASGGKCTGDIINVSSVSPNSPTEGDIWYDLNSGSLMIYTTDGDSSQWVDYTE